MRLPRFSVLGALLWPALVATCILASGCGATAALLAGTPLGPGPAQAVPGGDPRRGAEAIRAYGCGACHIIPGVPGARGGVGPSLAGFARHAYIAGKLANTPDNLARWIQHPQAVEPGIAMPDLGVSDADARDIAAYLYTLQ